MPPKGNSTKDTPTKNELEAIRNYEAQKPDYNALLQESKRQPRQPPEIEQDEFGRAAAKAIQESRAEFDQRAKESKEP